MESIPAIRLDQMTLAQLKAYALADNKLAENAGWDRKLVALELSYIEELHIDYALTLTGFEQGEIDSYFQVLETPDDEGTNDVPTIDRSKPAVTEDGTLWQLGQHRLLCADARKDESFLNLLGADKAQLGFVDPPFNCRKRLWPRFDQAPGIRDGIGRNV